MEYTAKEELVEMHEKYKKVTKLREESFKDAAISIVSAGFTPLLGVSAYRAFFIEQKIGWAIFVGAGSAICALNVYKYLRNSCKHNKEAKGLEKEVEEFIASK